MQELDADKAFSALDLAFKGTPVRIVPKITLVQYNKMSGNEIKIFLKGQVINFLLYLGWDASDNLPFKCIYCAEEESMIYEHGRKQLSCKNCSCATEPNPYVDIYNLLTRYYKRAPLNVQNNRLAAIFVEGYNLTSQPSTPKSFTKSFTQYYIPANESTEAMDFFNLRNITQETVAKHSILFHKAKDDKEKDFIKFPVTDSYAVNRLINADLPSQKAYFLNKDCVYTPFNANQLKNIEVGDRKIIWITEGPIDCMVMEQVLAEMGLDNEHGVMAVNGHNNHKVFAEYVKDYRTQVFFNFVFDADPEGSKLAFNITKEFIDRGIQFASPKPCICDGAKDLNDAYITNVERVKTLISYALSSKRLEKQEEIDKNTPYNILKNFGKEA